VGVGLRTDAIVDVEIDDHLSVSGYPAKFTFNCMIPAKKSFPLRCP
jgi:hypothetical protein